MLYLFRNISWLSFTQSLMNVCVLIWRVVIGASLSEPHTSESNSGFFIYIYIYIYIYISAVRTYSVNASSTLLTRTLRTPIRAGEKSKTMQVLESPFTSATPTD